MAAPSSVTERQGGTAPPSGVVRWLRRARRWLSSSSDVLTICYVLLGLYALPLMVLLAAFIASDGYARSSPTITFSMALAAIYASDVRETLGTFVVPFIMAYAVAGAQKDTRIEARTLWLFFTLAVLFLVSIVVYCAVITRIDTMLAQTDELPAVMVASRQQFLAMSESYVKELLVYISLLIGISQAKRAQEPQP